VRSEERSDARRDEPSDGWFCMTGECYRCTLMPFAAPTFVAYNVQRFTKAREPTARAAKGFPPPFTEADYLARGGQRRKPRRVKSVLADA
jgi:hypothetical protein